MCTFLRETLSGGMSCFLNLIHFLHLTLTIRIGSKCGRPREEHGADVRHGNSKNWSPNKLFKCIQYMNTTNTYSAFGCFHLPSAMTTVLYDVVLLINGIH